MLSRQIFRLENDVCFLSSPDFGVNVSRRLKLSQMVVCGPSVGPSGVRAKTQLPSTEAEIFHI